MASSTSTGNPPGFDPAPLTKLSKELPGLLKGGLSKTSVIHFTIDVVGDLVGRANNGAREDAAHTFSRELSGNPAGLTNDQIRERVIGISKTSGITQARGSEAMAALITTGKVLDRRALDLATVATAERNRVLEVPATDTAEVFAELGAGQPSKASIELNKRTGFVNYLKSGDLPKIESLEKQGKMAEAVALAQTILAERMKERTQKMAAARTVLDRADLSASGLVEKVDDQVREIGRRSTLQDRIDKQTKIIDGFRGQQTRFGSWQLIYDKAVAERDRLIEEKRQDELRAVSQQKATLDAKAESDATEQAQSDSKDEKVYQGITTTLLKALDARGVTRPRAPAAAKPTSSAPAKPSSTGIQRAEADGLQPCIAAACGCKTGTPDQEKQCDLKDPANKASQAQATQSEAAKSDLVERNLQTAPPKSEPLKTADEKPKEGDDELEKKTKKLTEDFAGVFKEGFVSLLEGGGRDAIDKIGKGLQKKLTQSVADALYDVTLKDAVAGFSKLLTGALKGPGAADGAPGVGGGGLLGGLGDMVKGLFGGISNMFSGIWDFASSGISSLFSGGSSLFSGLLSIFSAKGNVFASSGLHAYANSVVGKPTFFPFAHGIGLMGEAGPEAIMPLRRGSDGRLGVSAPMGGSGGGSLHYAPTNVFNIDSRSDRGAVLADLDRALQVNNQGQMEQLKRLRVVPQ